MKEELFISSGDEKRKRPIRPEYEKMRNNLLGLKSRDPAVFVGRETKNIADLVLNPEALYTRKTFTVEIKHGGNSELTNALEECGDYEQFVDCLEKNNYLISRAKQKALKVDFAYNARKIIADIKNDKELFLAHWKKYKHKYESEQIQKNSWPLYVGTMFLKCDLSGSKIHAPLVLRRAEIAIKDNRVYLSAYDNSPILNEKLAFLINKEYKVAFPRFELDTETSFQEVCKLYEEILRPVMKEGFTFDPWFKYLKKDEIIAAELGYSPGLVLFMAFPSGGKLRDKFLELLENDEIDNLLDTEVLSGIHKQVESSVWEGTDNIFRITATDLSQEKAIKASLRSSTIIWGPPGTGKSQTISNILANLLYQNKSVLVSSEKKAALDVIKERMGGLSKFLFFALVEKDTAKQDFYKGLQELVDSIEYADAYNIEELKPRPFLSKAEREFYKLDDELGKVDIDKLARAIEFYDKNQH